MAVILLNVYMCKTHHVDDFLGETMVFPRRHFSLGYLVLLFWSYWVLSGVIRCSCLILQVFEGQFGATDICFCCFCNPNGGCWKQFMVFLEMNCFNAKSYRTLLPSMERLRITRATPVSRKHYDN